MFSNNFDDSMKEKSIQGFLSPETHKRTVAIAQQSINTCHYLKLNILLMT